MQFHAHEIKWFHSNIVVIFFKQYLEHFNTYVNVLQYKLKYNFPEAPGRVFAAGGGVEPGAGLGPVTPGQADQASGQAGRLQAHQAPANLLLHRSLCRHGKEVRIYDPTCDFWSKCSNAVTK